MSILHVGHIQTAIEKRFRELIDLSDLPNSTDAAKRQDCFLTRGLSAFAISELSAAPDQVAAGVLLATSLSQPYLPKHWPATVVPPPGFRRT